MATYNRPGVYVNELPLAAAPGNRASAAVAAGAVLGAFAQGPDTITLVTSWYDFTQKYGGYNKQYPASFAVSEFFKNGGSELYVKRVLPTAAKKVAKANLTYTSTITDDTAGTLCTIAAKHRGIDGNSLRVLVSPSKTIREGGYFDISVYMDAGTSDYVGNTFTVANAADDVLVEQFNGVVFHDELSGDYAPTVLSFGSAYIRILEGAVTEYDASGLEIEPVVTYEVKKNIGYVPSPVIFPLSGANSPEADLTYEDYTGDAVFDPSNTDNGVSGTITGVIGNGTKVTYASTAALSTDDHVTISGIDPTGYNGTDVVITDLVTPLSTVITGAVGNGTNVTYFGGTDLAVGDLVTTTGSSVPAFNVTSKPVASLVTAVVDKTVSTVSGDGTNFTYTTSSAHGLAAGDIVSVTGASVDGYNVTNAIVASLDGNTKFLVAGTLTDSATMSSGKVNRAAGFRIAGTTTTSGTVSNGTAVRNKGFKAVNTTTTTVASASGTVVRADTLTDSYVVDDMLNFKEFEVIDQPLVFFLPDVNVKLNGWANSKWVYNAIIEWIESPNTQGRHFVIVETEADLPVDGALSASGALVDSSRAAVYYPHLFIKDPVGRSGGAIRKVGPSATVAGQFLATDRKVGPFKAPAGIDAKVASAIALERSFSPAELDALNSGVTTTGIRTGKNVVNAIRNLPGAGIVIMGARTLKQDGTANRYINMRRSLTYIEKRLNDLAQFAVFENNTEKLWARLITVLGTFLNDYRNQGGLRGTTIEQSFYIKCDGENNTNASIAAGEVHVEIGVALEYPAEFVVINLSQKTAE